MQQTTDPKTMCQCCQSEYTREEALAASHRGDICPWCGNPPDRSLSTTIGDYLREPFDPEKRALDKTIANRFERAS
ncbi:MAG: hypothetical protein PHV74_07445 [Dehalococcoidia bacterium]|nr:hypothetical protein [Dehalococcoidia bacterium]